MPKMPNTLFCLLFSVFFIVSNAQNTGDNATPVWIINKVIEKMGGETYLRSVKTLYTEMSTTMEGRPVTWVTKEMLPNQGAFQIVYNGRVVYEDWFNGKQGFESSGGKKTETDPNQLRDKFPRKNIFNELDYLDTTIYKMERLADEKVGAVECYKIKATFIPGNVRLLYIDKNTFNTIRQDATSTQNPSRVSTTTFSDFKKYGDLVYWSKLTMGEGSDAQVGTITTLIINDRIKEADFNK